MKGSDNDDEVAMHTHEGEHIGSKRKVRYTKGKGKLERTKKGQLNKMKVGRNTSLIFNVTKCPKLEAESCPQ